MVNKRSPRKKKTEEEAVAAATPEDPEVVDDEAAAEKPADEEGSTEAASEEGDDDKAENPMFDEQEASEEDGGDVSADTNSSTIANLGETSSSASILKESKEDGAVVELDEGESLEETKAVSEEGGEKAAEDDPEMEIVSAETVLAEDVPAAEEEALVEGPLQGNAYQRQQTR